MNTIYYILLGIVLLVIIIDNIKKRKVGSDLVQSIKNENKSSSNISFISKILHFPLHVYLIFFLITPILKIILHKNLYPEFYPISLDRPPNVPEPPREWGYYVDNLFVERLELLLISSLIVITCFAIYYSIKKTTSK